MQQKNKSEKIIRDTNYLAPFFETKLLAMLEDCKKAGLEIEIFETFRTPARQDWLYAQGRTREGAKVTRAKAWESLHQYLVACDCVFYRNKQWSWAANERWDDFHKIAKAHGFETLSFEKPHIQISGGLTTQRMKQICDTQGIIALWDVIERAIKS